MPYRLLLIPLMCLGPVIAQAADTVEFLSGAKASGKVDQIRKSEKEFDFTINVGGSSAQRTYPFSKVHAVTFNGKRFVLTPMPAAGAGTPGGTLSLIAVRQVIEAQGSTPPDWLATTELNYPETLDLSWPLTPPTKGWRSNVNIGQYNWDRINPNPGRWRSGMKLMYHVLELHKNEPALVERDKLRIGRMYFQLFQDYPRAAYWFQQVKKLPASDGRMSLAECYFRLGSKSGALKTIGTSSMPAQAIRLLGSMGETERAVKLAQLFANSSQKHQAFLLAGDACRSAGDYPQALKFYQAVLSAGAARNPEYTARFTGRAKDSIAAINLADRADVSRVADGKYQASSIGYNGQVEVAVTVDNHKITDVSVTKHREKQFYAALTDTPAQIVSKQSVQKIDGTTGATITSLAIIDATAMALAKGAK